MRRILIPCLIVALSFVVAPLRADISLSTGSVSFNYDTDGVGSGFSLISSRGDGLDNIETWVRYERAGSGAGPAIIKLSGATDGVNPNEVVFDDISIPGDTIGIVGTITPVLRFSLAEVDSETALLSYDLDLIGSSFDGGVQVTLDAFVSFDFEGNGISDTAQTEELPAGDVLLFDFDNQDVGLYGSKGTADAFDVYDRALSNPAFDAARFDTTDDFTATGSNLAFGQYLDYGTVPAVGGTGFSVSQAGSLGVSVPEPTTAMFLLMGTAVMTLRRKRS